MSGEITLAWDLFASAVREALREQALIREAGETEIRVVPLSEQPRLRGRRRSSAPPRSRLPRWPDVERFLPQPTASRRCDGSSIPNDTPERPGHARGAVSIPRMRSIVAVSPSSTRLAYASR